MNTYTGEFDRDDGLTYQAATVDPNGNILCPGDGGAYGPISATAAWVAQYNSSTASLEPNCFTSSGNASPTLVQAVECAFGDVVGSTQAAISANYLPNAVLSIPTNDGEAMPYVDCGTSGAVTCVVQPVAGDTWSTYWLFEYVEDLFIPGTEAYTAAIGVNPNYSLTAANLAADFTALNSTAIVPGQQIPCGLNNAVNDDAHEYQAKLSATPPAQISYLAGVPGTLPSWQTQTGLSSDCSVVTAPNQTQYDLDLGIGISNGGNFIEVQSDAWFTNLARCAAPLQRSLGKILTSTTTICSY